MELPFSLQSLEPLAALEKRWQCEKFEERGLSEIPPAFKDRGNKGKQKGCRAMLRDHGKLEDHK